MHGTQTTSSTLVATLGPASSSSKDARALIEAGADWARLNASHLEEDALSFFIDVAVAAGFRPERIVVDIQGGKTRLGWLPAPIDVEPAQEVRLVPAGSESGPDCLPVDRASFVAALQPGDTVRIDDGRVALSVLADEPPRPPSGRLARVEGTGRIEGRKGLALVGRDLELGSEILERDLGLLRAARGRGIRDFAVSYASSPGLLEAVREAASSFDVRGAEPVRIHTKLEQPVSIDRLERLIPASDTLWLCRGDLGAEAGLERLPWLQRRCLDGAVGRLPVFMAGQVLHHLTVSPRPTRSEACHVAELIWRGIDGFVLSDETATGPHGPEAVRWLRRLSESARHEP